MDKNRPLPPGEALDPYRESDYLHRKAEGFPEPLYRSVVETPEWEGAKEKYGDNEGDQRAKRRMCKLNELFSDKYRKKHQYLQ